MFFISQTIFAKFSMGFVSTAFDFEKLYAIFEVLPTCPLLFHLVSTISLIPRGLP